MPNVARETVQREVHAAERDRRLLLLLPVDREVAGRRARVAGDELRAVDEHPARAARGVVDLAVKGLDDLDDQSHDRLRREELSAEPALVRGELCEEVLVDEPERVPGDRPRQGRQESHELEEDPLLELLVAAREHSAQPCVDLLDRVHRNVNVRAEVLPLRTIDEP